MASPKDAGIPESAEWELWDKEKNELLDTFATEDEAIAVRSTIIEETGASEDQFIVGRIEWKFADTPFQASDR